MRVGVLNGVNLDVLGRRNSAHYGSLTLVELESRIYGWSRDLELTTRCRQTNHEGQFVEWCHDALDWADGVILNPGAWTHYSYPIRDAFELSEVVLVGVPLTAKEGRETYRRPLLLEWLDNRRITGK